MNAPALSLDQKREAALRAENIRLVNENIRLQDQVFALQAKLDFLESDKPEWYAPHVFKLSLTLENILRELMHREMCSKQYLHGFIYITRPDGGADTKILDVWIFKLRRSLERFGISIETHWGVGWFMKTEEKAKVTALLEAQRG